MLFIPCGCRRPVAKPCNVTRYHIYAYLLFAGLVLAPVFIAARQSQDSSHTTEQQGAMPDSLNEYQPDNEDEPGQDTLFFSGKEDHASLYDSTIISNRFVPDSVTQTLKQDKAFWYAGKDMQAGNEKTASHSFWEKIWRRIFALANSPLFRQVMWLLMLALFAAAVIWFLVQNKMSLFGSGGTAVFPGQEKEGDVDNIFTTNLQEAAATAAAKGDFRLAIRFDYLHLLKVFSQSGLIHYRAGGTNSEYLAGLYAHPCYKDFLHATRSYEYTWYGKIPVSRQQYESIHNNFSSLCQTPGILV